MTLRGGGDDIEQALAIARELRERAADSQARQLVEFLIEALTPSDTPPDPADYIVVPRPMTDGRHACIMPRGAGWAVLAIGRPRLGVFDDEWYYRSPREAIAALEAWDPQTEPEPRGWFRHPASGRRRTDADPAREFVQF